MEQLPLFETNEDKAKRLHRKLMEHRAKFSSFRWTLSWEDFKVILDRGDDIVLNLNTDRDTLIDWETIRRT